MRNWFDSYFFPKSSRSHSESSCSYSESSCSYSETSSAVAIASKGRVLRLTRKNLKKLAQVKNRDANSNASSSHDYLTKKAIQSICQWIDEVKRFSKQEDATTTQNLSQPEPHP